jgi:hypothetical protein
MAPPLCLFHSGMLLLLAVLLLLLLAVLLMLLLLLLLVVLLLLLGSHWRPYLSDCLSKAHTGPTISPLSPALPHNTAFSSLCLITFPFRYLHF